MTTPSKTLVDLETKFWQSMVDEDTDAALTMLTEPALMVTTLLDHRRVSKYDLSQLHARRWNVELDLRNLETTTGMDILS